MMRFSGTVGPVAVFCSLVLVSCSDRIAGVDDQPDDQQNANGLTATTVLKSTSLSEGGSAAQAAGLKANSSGTDVQLTPDNVSGEILSFLFATKGQQDEGILVFGDERPDTAWASAPLYPFDLGNPPSMPITTNIMVKPGFVGGTSEHAVAVFGYADFELDVAGTQKVMRVYMVDRGVMKRGDKLLWDGQGSWQWYDMDNQTFTLTRPGNPAVIEVIRDFTDPVRPLLQFYPLNVFLDQEVTLDPQVIAAASGVDAVVNFSMGNAVTLVGQTTYNVTDDVLITSFSLTQVIANWAESGLQAAATLVFW